MQKAVSPLSIQITAAILRIQFTCIYRMFLYINVRKFMWVRGSHIFTEQGPIEIRPWVWQLTTEL